MKNIIYIVAGGWSYTGESIDSASLFTNKETAISYGQWLVESEGYDYYKMVERIVETEHGLDFDTIVG